MSILKTVVQLKESVQPAGGNALSIDECEQIVEQAIKEAQKLDTLMNIAIVDHTGNLMYFTRMPGAWLGSVLISQNKAYTAHAFSGDSAAQGPISTEDLGKLAQPGEPLFGIQDTNDRVVIFGGGIPLYKDGTLVGAIGVSGSTVDNDIRVAKAGSKGFTE